MKLRDYQERGVEAYHRAVGEGSKRILFCSPTGGGKTVVAAHLIKESVRQGRRVVYVAHRVELLEQCRDTLVESGVHPERIGMIASGDCRSNELAPIQIASVQTLGLRKTIIGDELFIDEAHHAVAKTYREIAKRVGAKRQVGFTATPFRLDGVGLSDMFDRLIVAGTPSELIDKGYLWKPVVWSVPDDKVASVLSGTTVRRGEFDLAEAGERLSSSAIVGRLVDEHSKHASGRPTVAYASTIRHGEIITQSFRESGVTAENLHGGTSWSARKGMLDDLSAGRLAVVVTCLVLTEGWNCPEAKCGIVARPTMSTALHIQMCGRFMRTAGIGPPVILDHVGNTLRHGLPHETRGFDLNGLAHGDPGRPPCRECPDCRQMVSASIRVCNICGHIFGEHRREPTELVGELAEINEVNWIAKKKKWDALRELAASCGQSAGWAALRFRRSYGHMPPASFVSH